MHVLKPQKIAIEEECLVLTQGAIAPPRAYGAVNWRGAWTLTYKETLRYLKIWGQTILSPLVMTALFYAVFAFSIGKGAAPVGEKGVPFLQFLMPGLIMMAMAQSAFISPAISLLLSKLQGNIVDVLMPPLSPAELVFAYTISAILRGLLVGGVAMAALMLLGGLEAQAPLAIVSFALLGSLMLALMGLITGILSHTFDQMGAIQNFIIVPATFLSGTFFSLEQLPEKWRALCTLNPFFYMIDGFRFGFTGQADVLPLASAGMIAIVSLVLLTIAYWLVAKGTGLKVQ